MLWSMSEYPYVWKNMCVRLVFKSEMPSCRGDWITRVSLYQLTTDNFLSRLHKEVGPVWRKQVTGRHVFEGYIFTWPLVVFLCFLTSITWVMLLCHILLLDAPLHHQVYRNEVSCPCLMLLKLGAKINTSSLNFFLGGVFSVMKSWLPLWQCWVRDISGRQNSPQKGNP